MNKTIYETMARLAVNKSLLKEYSNSSNDRIVYMNDGTEFQIQIFNPYSYTIGVAFSFNENNGNYNSWNEQLLVIKPGQRVWLERYLNDEAKLLFSTYKVGNSKAAKEAIKLNGLVTIKFYKEKEQIKYQPITYQPQVWYNYCDTVQTFDFAPKNYCSQINGAASLDAGIDSITLSCDASSVTSQATSSVYTSAAAATTNQPKTRSMSKSIETGRVDKGSHSNQRFNSVNIDFEYYPFSTEKIQILPSSQKPVTASDLQKVYCSNCGRKLNTKYKYCPYCGAKVDKCPNNQKYEIIVCPYCGRRVRSNMMECPHCGEILR
jgi:DNA-directed RNA polymerase subunit RPC12/RpoP